MDKKILWESALAELQLNLSRANFQTWLKGKTAIVTWQNNMVEIGCVSPYVKDWVETRYQGQIKSILDRVTGENVSLIFIVSPLENNRKWPKEKTYAKADGPSPTPLFTDPNGGQLGEAMSRARLNPSFSLNNFVVGRSNQLSYAVAKAISESTTRKYNPFFVYGGVGVGKTHLIQGVGQEVLTKNTYLKVFYCSCEDFTNALVGAIQTKTTGDFRNKYRKADMLIIDDIHFLSGREATQEEVFHTFNALSAAGKQIILACDRPPVAITKLAERLRSRFEGGMVVDIGKPDIELREAILLQKCQSQNIILPAQLSRMLAEAFPSSIRDLEGGLIRLLTYAKLTKQPLSPALVKEVVGLTARSQVTQPNPKHILNKVGEYFSVSVQDIRSRRRDSGFVLPRQIAMYLLREDLSMPLAKIADYLGRKDHTGVLYSVNKIKREFDSSSKTRGVVGEIRKSVFT